MAPRTGGFIAIHRVRYFDRIDAASVQDTLLCDESNLRSLQFQIDHLLRALGDLPNPDADGGLRLCQLRQDLKATMSQLRQGQISADGLERMRQSLLAAADSIDHIWFSHSGAPRSINRNPGLDGGEAP